MKITLKKVEEGKVKDQVFTIPHATGNHYRKLLEIDETVDYSDMSVDDIDTVVGYVCDVFRNQFTLDEFYEGTPSHELIPVCTDVFVFVRTGKTPEALKKLEEDQKEFEQGND